MTTSGGGLVTRDFARRACGGASPPPAKKACDRQIARRHRRRASLETMRLRAGCGFLRFLEVGARAGDERRLQVLLDRLLRDHALGDVAARGELEHDVE